MGCEGGGTKIGHLIDKEKPLEGRQPFRAVNTIAVQLRFLFIATLNSVQA
jgi:hypothetical protein